MKDFRNLPARPKQPQPALVDTNRQYFIKQNLVKAVERSQPVKDAILAWLHSFESGISKKEFQNQLCKLDIDDSKAIAQLEKSKGGRTIKPVPRVKPPKLPTDIITLLGKYPLIAIEGAAGKKAIENFLAPLPSGGVYILDVNELILEYVDYQHRGKAGDIIEAANRADILIIEGLEKPIALAYHIRDTLYQLAAVRRKKENKYTISTWNYTHEWYIPEYKQLFEHFSV